MSDEPLDERAAEQAAVDMLVRGLITGASTRGVILTEAEATSTLLAASDGGGLAERVAGLIERKRVEQGVPRFRSPLVTDRAYCYGCGRPAERDNVTILVARSAEGEQRDVPICSDCWAMDAERAILAGSRGED